MSSEGLRPRRGRMVFWGVIFICAFVFVGLAVYHYRRLDRADANTGLVAELANRPLAEPTSVGDWPQWRGPNRDGASTETGLLTEWPKSGPKLLWEAKTGQGFASVVIAKGRAYTIFQDGPKEAVVCWDAMTGTEIWRHAYECSYKNSYGNGPRSTPAVDGGNIFTVGGTGIMLCLETEKGRVVWSKDLMQEFGASIPEWGVSFSPLVEGERVFIMPGGPNEQSLVALDRKTGAVLWQQCTDPASYSSPVSASIGPHRHIIFLTGRRIVGTVDEDGQELWSYSWPIQQNCNIATPIVMDNYVFISTGYGKGCALLKIERDGVRYVPKLVYKNRNMRNHFSSSVRHKDHLYGFDDSDLKCISLRTGEATWRERGFDKGSVLCVGDQLIVYGANGILALAEANPKEYVERSRFQFSKQTKSCWSVPVVANGLLYVRDQEKLACLDLRAR